MKKVLPVSVVIPFYNSSATIVRALESVVHQHALPSQIIVVDDCSSADEYVLLRKVVLDYPLVEVIRLPHNSGAAAARNAGIAAARFFYIAFLDADDSWLPMKLCIQYEVMRSRPDVSLSGHKISHDVDVDVDVDVDLSSIVVTDISLKSLLFKNSFSTPTVMMTNNGYFFDPALRYSEDYELWMRVAASHKVVYIDLNLAMVHKHFYGQGGLSGNLWLMEKSELLNYRRLFESRDIGLVFYISATLFSMLKFFVRSLKVFSRRVI